MSLASLPIELPRLIGTYLLDDGDTQSILNLARTCKALLAAYQPMLYRNLYLDRASHVLLPVAYAIFTKPDVAREVRSIRFPDLSTAPSTPRQTKRDRIKQATPPDRYEWPSDADHGVIRDQVARALKGHDAASVGQCTQLVDDGSREDLIAMLILANTPNLTSLMLRAMGPRDDDSCTRAIFRHAAASLTQLAVVEFGPMPADYELEEMEGEELSYSLFADILLLPAIETLYAYAVGPRVAEEIDEDAPTEFDFLGEIDTDNTTIRSLYISEQLTATFAHLDNLLERCKALEFLELIEDDNDLVSWETVWDVEQLQASLERRADTLTNLTLADCLFNSDTCYEDNRSNIYLGNLNHVTYVYLDECWVFDVAGLDEEARRYDVETDKDRLVTMLPDSTEHFTLRTACASETDLNESLISALKALVEQHRDGEGFPNLERLSIEMWSPGFVKWYEGTKELKRPAAIWKQYKEVFDLAVEVGLTVDVFMDRRQDGYYGPKAHDEED